VAGGSDSYGYVSQADLWLDGNLHLSQPQARQAPWPFAQWTLSPLGYRPSVDRGSIVPVYAPGLPIMMAAAKGMAGQGAMAWLVPLFGGLLVWATFAIGRLTFSDQIGAAGAFLVATSPTLIYMLAQPMSDLPVAACWALATYGCLLDSRKGILLAGCSAATAILVRPNLAHLAGLMALWLLVREVRAGRLPVRPWRFAMFALPVVAAAAGVALLYRDLYGSATTSGYGPVGMIYTLSSGPANLWRYGWWLIQSQTPLALAGVVAVFLPAAMLKSAGATRGRSLLALICAGAVAGYLFWNVFDAWWYLRFLLPAWPAIFLSAAWLLAWPSGRSLTKPAAVVLACVGFYGIWFAYRAGAFDFGEGDRRYATAARLVRSATPPNSIIISTQHSGSVRYYGGRMSLRYDWLSERWLDRSVEWLGLHGVHPYILLDEGEIAEFRRRFAGLNVLGQLNVAKVWEYHGSTHVILFDPLQPARPGEQVVIITTADVKIPFYPEPAPPPELVIKD
jgi:hypothetical protein